MHGQYIMASFLILGGIATVVGGPDTGGENPDGTPGPVKPEERIWVQLFGISCIICGVVVLIATLLGFRGQPGEASLT